MPRKPLKTLSQEDLIYIPEDQKDLDVNAKELIDRPMIFTGRRLTREEFFAMQDIIEREMPEDISDEEMKGLSEDRLADVMAKVKIKGNGAFLKFLFDKLIIKIQNVVFLKDDDTYENIEELKGKEKYRVWNAVGNDAEIIGACYHFFSESKFTESEVKN